MFNKSIGEDKIYISSDIFNQYKVQLDCNSFSKEYSFTLNLEDEGFKDLKNQLNQLLPAKYNMIKQDNILKNKFSTKNKKISHKNKRPLL